MESDEKSNMVLYFHKTPDDKVFYVGIGNKYRPYSKSGRSKWWKNIVNKHGYTVDIILENISKEKAVEMECYYIKHFGRADIGLGNLVNMTDGGEGNHNRKHSQETKDKISRNSAKVWLGKKLSVKTRKKLSESHVGLQSGENHPLYGKSRSEETKRKIGESNKGKKHSQKTIKKISESKTGKPKSDEHKKSLSKSLLGKKKTDEHRKKLSESHKGKILSKEHKNKISNSLKGRSCSSEKSDKISVKAKMLSASKGNKISEYKGITWSKDRNKWKACIYFEGKTHFVGYFDDDVMAFEKYEEFKKILYEQQPQEQ